MISKLCEPGKVVFFTVPDNAGLSADRNYCLQKRDFIEGAILWEKVRESSPVIRQRKREWFQVIEKSERHKASWTIGRKPENRHTTEDWTIDLGYRKDKFPEFEC